MTNNLSHNFIQKTNDNSMDLICYFACNSAHLRTIAVIALIKKQFI